MNSISGIPSTGGWNYQNYDSTKAALSSSTSSSDNPTRDSLDNLVSGGTITQNQEDAIATALAPPTKNSGAASSSAMFSSTGNPNEDFGAACAYGTSFSTVA